MSCAQFKLDMFEGPLDLLLHLISKHKLNIHDIQISLLLEQYLEYIHQLEHEDLEDAADFLEMAARLIYIKTVSLLPHDEEAQELKKELEGRLIEYSQCKYLAGILAKSFALGEIFVRKPAQIPVDKTYTREHEPETLLEAYLGLSEKARSEKPINAKMFQPLVSHKIVSIGTKIVYILKRLYTCGVCDLSHIYDGMESKSERVATFLAILELTKSGRIVLNDDNTQISFSDKSINRKKHSKVQESEADVQTQQTEQAERSEQITAEQPSDPEQADMEELTEQEQAVPEEEKLLQEGTQQPFEVHSQQIPEFEADDSVYLPPEPKAEAADKPKAVTKQLPERVAEVKPMVLQAPCAIEIPAVELTQDEPEQAEEITQETAEAEPAEDKGAQEQESAQEMIQEPETEAVTDMQLQDKPEQAEDITQETAEAEPAADKGVQSQESAQEMTQETETETVSDMQSQDEHDQAEEITQETAEAEPAEDMGAQAQESAQKMTQEPETETVSDMQLHSEPEQAEDITQETAETEPAEVTETELPQEKSAAPFKQNYWASLRYYWGHLPVADSADRNCWRYGRAHF